LEWRKKLDERKKSDCLYGKKRGKEGIRQKRQGITKLDIERVQRPNCPKINEVSQREVP